MADVDEFGVNHIVLAAVLLARVAAAGGRLGTGGSGGRFVHRFGELVAGRSEPVHGGVDPVGIIIGNGFLGFLDGRFDFFSARLADLVAMLLQSLLDVVNHGVGLVLGLNRVAELTVVGGM